MSQEQSIHSYILNAIEADKKISLATRGMLLTVLVHPSDMPRLIAALKAVGSSSIWQNSRVAHIGIWPLGVPLYEDSTVDIGTAVLRRKDMPNEVVQIYKAEVFPR